MATFTPSNTGARFTDTDGDVSFTATSARAMFTAAYQSVTGGGGGAVDSVNGQTGVVVLDANDVGATTAADVDDQIESYHLPFNASVRAHVPVSNFGGTVGGGEATIAAFAGIPTGRTLWLEGQTDPADDGFYTAAGAGVFTLSDVQPLESATYVGRAIVVGVDLEVFVTPGVGLPSLYVVTSDGVTITANRTAVHPDKLTATLADYALLTQAALFDQRQAFAAELAAGITNVFRCDGLSTGRWSTPNLTTEFAAGISYRCLRIPRRPATVPFFAEYLTQPHDSGVGAWDNLEGADLWTDDSFAPSAGTPAGAAPVSGEVRDFHEQTESGGSEDGSGWWPDLLLAADLAIETMTDITFGTGVGRKWLRVPYELDDGGTYHTDADDGAVFRLMSTFTSEKFESIDAHTEEWWLGNSYSGDIVRLIVRDGLDGTLIANPDASQVTPGATSFVDGAGNTWTGGAAAEVVELNPTGGTVDVVSNVASSRILGRVTSGSGDSEELTAAQVRSLLGDPWVTITDTTLGTAAASFSVDTTGYNELEVMLSGRGDATAGPTVGMRVQFNGDTGSNYLSNTSAASTAWNGVGTLPASQTNTDRRGLWTAKITLGHTSSETTAICVGTHRTSTSATGTVPQTLGAYYTNTSAAITSMLIFPSSGNWAAGTRLLVRGKV